jgi:prepilin-type N-terminal cleavage/methylation domain-containing protein
MDSTQNRRRCRLQASGNSCGAIATIKRKAGAGFTLIELLIVMGMVAILLSLGTPAMTAQVNVWRSYAQASRLLSAIMTARSQAVRGSTAFLVCPGNPDRGQCDGRYTEGFSVVSAQGNLRARYGSRRGVSVWNSSGTREEDRSVAWGSDGWGSRNMSWVFCVAGDHDHWAVVVNRIGRPRMLKNWGTCPA